jgi:hypothetical protein
LFSITNKQEQRSLFIICLLFITSWMQFKINCSCCGENTAFETIQFSSHDASNHKPVLRWSGNWWIRVMISYVFAHTFSILGPLCTKYTLKWSTIFPMQITCMNLHVMISSECLVTHGAWKCPNLSLQSSLPACNSTSINSQPKCQLHIPCEKSNNRATHMHRLSHSIFI